MERQDDDDDISNFTQVFSKEVESQRLEDKPLFLVLQGISVTDRIIGRNNSTLLVFHFLMSP